MRNIVKIYSRHNCHLCDVALETLIQLQPELDFDIEKEFIDGNPDLEKKYGEQVPVVVNSVYVDDDKSAYVPRLNVKESRGSRCSIL